MNANKILSKIFIKTIQNGDSLINDRIKSNQPLMIGRFGSVEIKATIYPKIPIFIQRHIREKIFFSMQNNAGFFKPSDISIKKFSDLILKDAAELDILGSWRIEEQLLLKNLNSCARVELKCLEPYLSKTPWTQSLAGKKILVIHPFNKTIENQYNENRLKIFKNKSILPEFKSIRTIRAVQSIANNAIDSKFLDWFDALNYMKSLIDKEDYDIAIIGCGAYGLPLAAHVKRSGKIAIHLGGATQILFGIRGKRWDGHPEISKLYNDYWVRPAPEETPEKSQNVENGCYW